MKALGIDVRPYRDEDEPSMLECLTASLGEGPAGRRPPEFFRWKHFENPFGSSFMLVAEAGGRIVGLRAFMRWRFHAGERTLSAVRAVDTATHPDFQGRGIFSRLTLAAIDALRGEVDFIFNTPNPISLQGYLKMGWKPVGRVPVAIRIRRPVRFAMRFRGTGENTSARPAIGAPSAAEALAGEDMERLLVEARTDDPRLHTERDADYLRWRYGAAPLLDYRAMRDESDGTLRGVGIFRVRPRGSRWESTVSELIVRPGDVEAGRRLIRRVERAAAVDHLACHFARGSTSAAVVRRAGFIRAPGGMTMVAKPLRDDIVPSPTDLDSWALSIGDLEVF